MLTDPNDPRETCLALGTYTEHRPHRVGEAIRPFVHRRFHCHLPVGHDGPHHDRCLVRWR